jgi:hypothetical protein
LSLQLSLYRGHKLDHDIATEQQVNHALATDVPVAIGVSGGKDC